MRNTGIDALTDEIAIIAVPDIRAASAGDTKLTGALPVGTHGSAVLLAVAGPAIYYLTAVRTRPPARRFFDEAQMSGRRRLRRGARESTRLLEPMASSTVVPWRRRWARSRLPMARVAARVRAQQINAPMLIIHPGQDRRCSVEQGQRMYFALKLRGADVEMLQFPG